MGESQRCLKRLSLYLPVADGSMARFKIGGCTIWMPILACLVISLILTILLNLFSC
jgi:hypothetical protein